MVTTGSIAAPTSTHTIQIGLYCATNNSYQKRKAYNLTTSSFLVYGNTCGSAGTEFDVIFNTLNRKEVSTIQFPAQITRNTLDGSLFQFMYLREQDKRALENIIYPKWDGVDLFEGMMILASYENVTDLTGWLKLTSLATNEYKKVCCTQRKK